MTEAYLHYIWKHRLFEPSKLVSVSGEKITILNSGSHNMNAGPDFLETRIKIGEQEWAGHVEIHTSASDWQKHHHQKDKAYNNVVLHVVYEADAEVFRADGTRIPTMEIKGTFDEMGYWKYEQFISTKRFLACENLLHHVEGIHMNAMLDRMLIERMEYKSQFVEDVYERTGNDWSETFYRTLFYAFGLKVNAETMLMLAERLPQKVLQKHQNHPFQLEALVYGASGLLASQDEFAQKLEKEFQVLATKYSLLPLEKEHWKLARLRPASFPTIRLAQLIAVLQSNSNLFSALTHAESITEVKKYVQKAVNPYWKTHYRFAKSSPQKDKSIADSFLNIVLINAIIPTLFFYGSKTGRSKFREKAIEWLEELEPEHNNITKRLKSLGFSIDNAAHSQSAIQLYNTHCQHRKCLSCAIGVKLLNQ